MSRPATRLVLSLLVPVALALPACGGDDEGDGGSEGGASTVEVTLQEFAVVPAAASVAAGSITFEATNNGPEDDHELVVIKTDLSPEALPTNEDGSVNEEGEGIEALGEIPEFAPGTTESVTLDLTAGSYVLICNVYTVEEQESHYQEGMRVAFTVT